MTLYNSFTIFSLKLEFNSILHWLIEKRYDTVERHREREENKFGLLTPCFGFEDKRIILIHSSFHIVLNFIA
jgi:hypothetical protein